MYYNYKKYFNILAILTVMVLDRSIPSLSFMMTATQTQHKSEYRNTHTII